MPGRRHSSLMVAGLAGLLVALAGCGAAAQLTATEHGSGTGGPRAAVGAGVSVRYPGGWQLIAPPVTALSSPVERLLLTSYPTRRGGNCSPERAERGLPDDGALIYLFEYRPERGAVWQHLRRRDFPPQPAHFVLRRRDLASFECWRVPSYVIRFRTADRPFQMHVALGKHATATRRAQVLGILDSLRFSPLAPPPPDPYAGWRSLIDEPGDSIRTPPHWPAAVSTSPRRYSRPRTLFFASNLTLRGLAAAPPRSARKSRRLPSPFPAAALDAFPDNGVLLWVREDPKGTASDTYPPLPRRRWPQAEDFRTVRTGPARRWPHLRWERAAAEQQRHRFSVWVISAPGALESDRALARKAAAALALSSGDFRDATCRRACKTG